ncbi:SDR family oxidoreductase [Methylobacillus sp.]|uniref:SDR family oxidoreductase n=1 Tax=Methylobacillus sp. TaxID=56818 RepID=UPI002FE3A20E
MSRILVAGCGDLGMELARRLAEAGNEVIGLRRSVKTMPAGVQLMTADVASPTTLERIATIQPEILVYCVAATEHSDENYRLSYVEGLRNVLAALKNVPLQHIFFVSSTGVYGQETHEWLDEDIPPLPTDFSGQRMLEAEALLAGYPATVLRFSGIYGPGRTRMIRLAQVPAQWPPKNGWTNRIHRDDGAAFIQYLIGQLEYATPARLYLVTDSQPVALYDVLHWLAQQLQVEAETIATPTVAGNKRLSNQRMLATGYRFIYPDYVAGYQALLNAGY